MSKRIKGLGALDGAALVLTRERTRKCGHLLAEGYDGGENAREARYEVTQVARRQATRLGRPVEVFASAPGRQGWVVDVVEPA